MEKLKMQTKNKVDVNIETIGSLFPNTVTEKIKGYDENSKPIIEKAIDFDILKQELSKVIVEGREERYQMNWPGKKGAILRANAPINMTLRPCREESVDFDNTENLYIEGDNLEVLKLLQETYLNKVKMIYIDPPYNTGNDSLVYSDNFAMSSEKFSEESGQYDEDGKMLYDIRKNNERNGKFHTDWLNMMYPRLKLARDLLSEDGVIFISIDDNEIENLKKMCNEVFGENNLIDIFSWKKTETPANLSKLTKKAIEYIVAYRKSNMINKLVGIKKESQSSNGLMNQTNSAHELIFPANIVDTGIKDGIIEKGEYGTKSYEIHLLDNTEVKDGYFVKPVKLYGKFKWSQDNLNKEIAKGTKISIRTVALSPSYEKQEYEVEKPWNIIERSVGVGTNENASKELDDLIGINVFDFPKPTSLIKYLVNSCTAETDIILDFFSGSATTAHAVMQLNAEDGGNRKFIMVQIQELTDEKSEAYKSGYKNTCEIGKERIRRAGKKIKEENPDKADNLDTGFRVLKLDSSNMKDVFYNPGDINQSMLDEFESNIKEDRSSEDLLFQVMLDLGELLSSDIEEIEIQGKKVFNVGQGNIVACFDIDITEEVVKEIANMKPFYAVFRDSSLSNDSVATNFEQIFKTYSPNTIRKVL